MRHSTESTIRAATTLAERGIEAYLQDPALPLAFEALVNRVGDLAKRLTRADAARFADPMWSAAARTRDFVAHHDDRVDTELLWCTVTVRFPQLLELVDAESRR
ncbi:MAG: HepT-like ribonuclease domain-containing protein [Microbacterium sp.]